MHATMDLPDLPTEYRIHKHNIKTASLAKPSVIYSVARPILIPLSFRQTSMTQRPRRRISSVFVCSLFPSLATSYRYIIPSPAGCRGDAVRCSGHFLTSKRRPLYEAFANERSYRYRNVHVLHARPFSDDDFDEENKDKDKDRDEKTESWLSTGARKKSSFHDLKMRESIKLGGMPRSKGYSSKDWFHSFVTLPTSVILRDIRSPVVCIGSWAAFISFVHRKLMTHNPALAAKMCIPSTPHSLVVSALGLLLVFRTNSAYQRFAEGRKIWEHILSYSRDLSRMVKLYELEIGVEKRRRVQRLLAAFPYLLRHRIRPNLVMRKLQDPNYTRDENSLLLYDDIAQNDNDEEAADVAKLEEDGGMSRRKTRELYWVDKRTLPWRLLPTEVRVFVGLGFSPCWNHPIVAYLLPQAMEGCARAQNRPLWVADRMSKELVTVPDQPNFTARERLSLLSKSLGLWTGPVIGVITWLLFGVYEIGYSIEDPFQGTLRLAILCDGIRRDVFGDVLHRETAFKLDDEEDDDSSLDDDEEEGVGEQRVPDEGGEAVNEMALAISSPVGELNGALESRKVTQAEGP